MDDALAGSAEVVASGYTLTTHAVDGCRTF